VETLGQYQLLQRIAIGGMAEIFLAEKPGPAGFSRRLAIKRILPHRADDAEFVEMFLNEARLAALLNHPNIVQIYDLGEVDKTYYIAMEYVDGYDLGQILDKCEENSCFVPPGYVARLIGQAAVGLHYAHNYCDPNTRKPLKLVHRDISLPNIMVSRDGIVKLLDFGIAKASSTQRDPTQTGILKGKISYMSPEYLRGEQTDGRHDLFALGVVMYELATGQKPFHAKGEVQMLQAILTQPPRDPYAFNPSLPKGLVDLMMNLLTKDPKQRIQTGAEIQSALDKFLYQTRQQDINQAHISEFISQLFGEVSGSSTPSPTSRPPASSVRSPQAHQQSKARYDAYQRPPAYTPNVNPPSYRAVHTPEPTPALNVSKETVDISAFQSMPDRSRSNPVRAEKWMEETRALSIDNEALSQAIKTPQHTSQLPGFDNFSLGQAPTEDIDYSELAQNLVHNENEAESSDAVDKKHPPKAQESVKTHSEGENITPQITPRWMMWLVLFCFILGGGIAAGFWMKSMPQKGKGRTQLEQKDPKHLPDSSASQPDAGALPQKIAIKTDSKKIVDVPKLPPKPERQIARDGEVVDAGIAFPKATSDQPPLPDLEPQPNKFATSDQDAKTQSKLIAADPKAKAQAGVYISTSPSRCSVFWKGKRFPHLTPAFFDLPPGRHELMLVRYSPDIRYPITVNVPENNYRRQHVTIREGYLEIRTSHTARIFINNRNFGQTPVKPIRLYAGYHDIRAQATDSTLSKNNFSGRIMIKGNTRRKLSLKFR
jgi:serine/threonine-protein kinase